MAKKKPETQAPAAEAVQEHTAVATDGPTRIEPQPPPPLMPEEPKRKRGRPPGSTTKKKPDAVPVVDLADVKRELAQASALAVAFTRDAQGNPAGTLGELADSLGWHRVVRVVVPGAPDSPPSEGIAIAPSDRLEKAAQLMGPYLAESGALDLVQLSPAAKFAIGLGVLMGPTVLLGFQKLWDWAMHPPKAAARIVPMAPRQEKPQEKS